MKGHQYGPLFIFALATGLRISELAALTWDDIDLDKGTVRVDRGLVQVAGRHVLSSPKTNAGRRLLKLVGMALETMRQHRIAVLEETADSSNASGYVFTSSNGRPLDRRNVERVLGRLCDRHGLPRLTPHGLRHLSGSLALANGATLVEVSRHLGHSSVAITAEVYLHHVSDNGRVADALSKALSGTTRGGKPVNNDDKIGELIQAVLLAGSDYSGAYRKGSKVALELEEATGRVIVTRGRGAVKLGYVIGPDADKIAAHLLKGYRYSGHIADVSIGPGGKVMRLQLTPSSN